MYRRAEATREYFLVDVPRFVSDIQEDSRDLTQKSHRLGGHICRSVQE